MKERCSVFAILGRPFAPTDPIGSGLAALCGSGSWVMAETTRDPEKRIALNRDLLTAQNILDRAIPAMTAARGRVGA